jgi:hypothetical protein
MSPTNHRPQKKKKKKKTHVDNEITKTPNTKNPLKKRSEKVTRDRVGTKQQGFLQ